MSKFSGWTPGGATRQIRFVAVSTAVAMMASGMFAAQASAAGAKPWNLKSVTGNVQVKAPGGSWHAAAAGTTLVPGSVLKTDATGRAVLYHHGDVVTESPNSQASFHHELTRKTPSVVQTFGTLLYRIVHRPNNKFNVQTPYLTAVIKGTVFSVTVNSEGGALHVARGLVQVTSRMTGQIEMVHVGQTAAVSDKPGIRMKLLGKRASRNSETRTKTAQAKGPFGHGNSLAGGAHNGNAFGLRHAVRLANFDIFKTSNGLIRGPHEPNGHGVANAGAAGHNGEGHGHGNSSVSAFDVPGAPFLSVAQNNGGGSVGGGNAGGNGGGNAGGNGGGNAGGNGGGNAGGNSGSHGNGH